MLDLNLANTCDLHAERLSFRPATVQDAKSWRRWLQIAAPCWSRALLWATRWQTSFLSLVMSRLRRVQGLEVLPLLGRINNTANRFLYHLQRWSLIDTVMKWCCSWSALKGRVEDNHLADTGKGCEKCQGRKIPAIILQIHTPTS